MKRRKWISLLMAVVLVLQVLPGIVFATGGGPGNGEVDSPEPHNGMVSPNYKPSPQDRIWIAQKEHSLKRFIHESGLDKYEAKYEELYGDSAPLELPPLPPVARGVSPKWWYYERILPLEREWKEPNDEAHVNYCGPGASQVALDVRLPAMFVPSIDTIGDMENIDPNWGVYMNDVMSTLNLILREYDDIPNSNGFVAYELASPGSPWSLFNYVKWDNERWYATVSGVYTEGMPGWHKNAYHIVAIFGLYYNSEYENYYEYAETSSPTAGYYGPFSQWRDIWTFFDWYSRNPTITW
jgi:hypothetical protein